MTTEELDERLAAHEATIKALLSSFIEPTVEATRIMAASEERAKQEREAYNKRAAEHDAQARAQHERAAAQQERQTEALSLQRRNVEAWERIAGALERHQPTAQPPPVCTGSMQPVMGYGAPTSAICPICGVAVSVLIHQLGFSIPTHAYRPTIER